MTTGRMAFTLVLQYYGNVPKSSSDFKLLRYLFLNMVKIIDGKKLADKIKDNIVKEIVRLNGGKDSKDMNRRPNLAIILIGDRDDSELYVSLKEKEAQKVGIDTHLYKCPKNITDQEVLEIVKCLNEDDSIDGILTQLPLPDSLDTDAIMLAVDLKKDVDGFHPDNLEKLLKSCQIDCIMPPVFGTIIEMLESIDYNIDNKKVCIIANSDIFGKSLGQVLNCRGGKIVIVNPEEKDLVQKTKEADLLITAIGKPRFIKKGMIKKGVVIIDIGITKQGKKVYGDVDFEDVKEKASYITPVPGGVGPMTIAMALKNTLEVYKSKYK